jgi:hypothetical protein
MRNRTLMILMFMIYTDFISGFQFNHCYLRSIKYGYGYYYNKRNRAYKNIERNRGNGE